jgi:CRISPR system Cascade subunit CasA
MNTKPENRFNLVDEAWIPVTGEGLVSLQRIFADKKLRAVGGNPVQKIALTKLLLAIAQAAHTPKDDEEWAALGAKGMAERTVKYLEEKRDLFWLYGERPFLQMPVLKSLFENRKEAELSAAKNGPQRNKALERATPRQTGKGDFPDLPSDNNTILFQNDSRNDMTDADKALFILSMMPFALSGKQVDNEILIDKSYSGKSSIAKVGPSLGRACYLHTFLTGLHIHETLFMNLWTLEKLKGFKYFENVIGVPPWENMPETECCRVANKLKTSYMGALVSLCRFLLLSEKGVYFTEGIQYPNHKDGWAEPSIALNRSGEVIKVLQVKTDKKPWRELTSLLSFVGGQDEYDCQQLKYGVSRILKGKFENINVWSAGIRVSGDAFGQKVRGIDDYVESLIELRSQWLGEIWFTQLKTEMSALEDLSKVVFGATNGYFKNQKADVKDQVDLACNLFWQLSERSFQTLVDACNDYAADHNDNKIKSLRKIFANYVNKAFDTYCPKETARQLDAWAANRPNLGKYLTKE